jgi:hypothetical protein
VEKGWLGRREEVSNRARWSSWYGGRGEEDVRYLREIWETRPGVGDGTLGASGRKKSLVMSRSARSGETNSLVQGDQTLLLS